MTSLEGGNPTRDMTTGGQRYDKFTPVAREALVVSEVMARQVGAKVIDTEHLLLGIMGVRDSIGRTAMEGRGFNDDTVLRMVRATLNVSGDQASPTSITDFSGGLTPRSKKAIELAVEEVRRGDKHYIGTEHLLVGLARTHEGLAALIIQSAIPGGDEMVRGNVQGVIAGISSILKTNTDRY